MRLYRSEAVANTGYGSDPPFAADLRNPNACFVSFAALTQLEVMLVYSSKAATRRVTEMNKWILGSSEQALNVCNWAKAERPLRECWSR